MLTRETLAAIVGEAHVRAGEAVRAETRAWDTRQPCRAALVVEPASTPEVAAVLKACHEARQPVVTWGGVTNLVQACATSPADIVLSTRRMNAIDELDAVGQTLTAGAGLTLRDAQQAAAAAGLLYPVDIGARDACTLGGNIATNAGGTHVIRYGMTRDAVLGLEAVLADGTVLSSMNRFLKNNSGPDLKQLFVGSEGILGVVTRVVMRLYPAPQSHDVALLACRDYDAVLALLGACRRGLGSHLSGFEVMWDSFYERVVAPDGRLAAPLRQGSRCYVLVESMGSSPARDAAVFAELAESLFADGTVDDGVIAKSAAERDSLWAVRHEVEWIVRGAQNFDVSLAVRDIGAYVEQVEADMAAAVPGAYLAAFGHLGDNNLHLSVLHAETEARCAAVETVIYGRLADFGGAVSAEHGIGLEKRHWLGQSRTPQEIELMRRLKATLDPHDILNPGKVLGEHQAPAMAAG